MPSDKNSGDAPPSKLVRFIKTPLGKICAAVLLLAVTGDVIWLLNDQSWRSGEAFSSSTNAPVPTKAEQAARARRDQILSYVKPTVTAAMGDRGGTYFGQKPDPAKTRHYYIAAEVDQWDFMPSGTDEVCGMPVPPNVLAKHKDWKVRYVQYTDQTFTQKVPQPARLGILGPVLRGVVGEYIEVTFLNRALGGVFSMHPHGVKYDKDSEGSYHSDAVDKFQSANNSGQPGAARFEGLGAAVGYGARFTYVWYCDETSGPLPSEPSSKGWLYHSHVSSGSEINLGLEGFIIVTDPKRARPDGTPNDVDREMAALFMIFDESGVGDDEGAAVDAQQWTYMQLVKEHGQRFAINGSIYGNLHGLDMNEGERVRWYLFGLGSEQDLHTAHWHGMRVVEDGRHRTDVVELLPASMKIADMVADNPGSWLFHCHVEEHMAGGMFARLTVYPKDQAGASRAPEKAFFGLPPPSP
jgi:uncharacterized cupredoxin-like copper-binding protein